MKISVCFPAFNESENINHTLTDALSVLNKMNYNWEVIVVNDGSSDNTEEVVSKFVKKYRKIKLFNHPQNLGYAATTKTCLAKSTGDVVFVIDSDRQHNMKDIPKFIRKVNEGYDIVVGWKKKRNDPPIRILMSKVYNFLFSLIFNYKLHDVDCGFRCLTRKAVRKVKIEYFDIPVGPEIIAKGIKYGFRIAEIPVVHYKRIKGKSVWKLWKIPYVGLKVISSLIKLKYKTNLA